MKKVLLATTALGVFAAGSAMAAAPTVTIGGVADVQVGAVNQAYGDGYTQNGVAHNEEIYSSDVHSRTDTEIHVKVDGRTDSGLGYGAHIELEADVNGDDNTTANNNAERGFIYVESALGRVEAGATGSASEALKVDAGTFARATGGVSGDFYHYVDLDGNSGQSGGGNVLSDTFVFLPELPTAAFPGMDVNGNRTDLATANKISYYSPRVSGVQAGVSYTPDLNERGTASGFSGALGNNAAGTADTHLSDIWNAGINYQAQYEQIGIEASVTGEKGTHEEGVTTGAGSRDDLAAYALGLNLSFQGFTVGGSWAEISEFGRPAGNGVDADFWTLGGAYEFGPFAASVTYLSSEVSDEGALGLGKKFENVVVGADYQLAPGLVPYVEVAFFDTDDGDATTVDNDGNVFLVGTELTF